MAVTRLPYNRYSTFLDLAGFSSMLWSRTIATFMNREKSATGALSQLARGWKSVTEYRKSAILRPRHVWVGALILALVAADAAAYSMFNLSLREASVHSAALNVLIWTAVLAIAAWHAPREVRSSLTLLTVCTAVGGLIFLPIALSILPAWELAGVTAMVVFANATSAWVLVTGSRGKQLGERDSGLPGEAWPRF